MAIRILVNSIIKHRNCSGYRVVELQGVSGDRLICKFMNNRIHKLKPSDISILGILSEGYFYKNGVIYRQCDNKPIIDVRKPKEFITEFDFTGII